MPRYSLTVVTPPAAEPISLELAKAHLRIDHDEEDDLIKAWIAGARELTEGYTGRRWVTQTLRMTMPYFPGGAIELPVEPVSAVTSLSYLGADGVLVEYATEAEVSAAFQVVLDGSPPVVAPLPLGYWPDTEAGRLSAVTIEFEAGGAENAVPEMVKQAVLQIVGQYDEARGDQNWLTAKGVPPSAKALLNMLSTGSYLC